MTSDITRAVVRFFAAIDGCDWEAARALMTNPFHLDYSSFGAAPGAEVDPAEVLGGWKAMLPGFDATHHHLGPLDMDINGDVARVRCTVIGTHQIVGAEGGDLWTVLGSYEIGVVRREGRWVLSALIFHYKCLSGNTDLPALARERVG